MRFASRLLLCLCLVSPAVSSDESNSETKAGAELAPATAAKLQQAQTLFAQSLQAKGNARLEGLQQAYQQLQQAAEADRALPPARTMWAKMLIAAGDSRSGRLALQQAVIEQADDPEAYVLLASIAMRNGQLAEAQLCYDTAERLTEALPAKVARRTGLQAQIAAGQASVALARSRLATQNQLPALATQYDRAALAELQEWVAVEPENAAAHEQLAAAMFNQGDLEAATRSFNRARQLNPALPITGLRLAQLFLASGKRELALDHLQRAIASQPDNLNVRVSAAELFMAMNELEKAGPQLDQAAKLNEEDLATQRLQAQLLRFHGKWSEAAEKLQALSNLHPTDFEIANLLALTLSEMDTPEAHRRALSLATVAAQRFEPNTREGLRARITLIWAAYVSGRGDTSKQALQQMLTSGIQSNQLSGDEAFYLSRLLVEFGRPELALPLLNSSLSRTGSFPKRAASEALLAQLK